MYQSDYDEFVLLMRDLCASRDRPTTDERLRAYWEALKPFPIQRIRARIRAAIATSAKWPTPADLRPAGDEQHRPPTPAQVIERLDAYAMKRYAPTLRQWRGASYLHRKGDPCSLVGLLLPADGDRPGYRVMLEDVNLEGVDL